MLTEKQIMTDKPKGKKSVLPLKLQVLIAVVLGTLFIFLLVSRLKGMRPDEVTESPTKTEESSIKEEPGASHPNPEIDIFIEKLSREQEEKNISHLPSPDSLSDPFTEPARRSEGILSKVGQMLPMLESLPDTIQKDDHENDRQSREEYINSLSLKGTLIDGNARFAVINSRLYAENDDLGKFKITRIEERAVLIEDGIGDVMIRMGEDDL